MFGQSINEIEWIDEVWMFDTRALYAEILIKQLLVIIFAAAFVSSRSQFFLFFNIIMRMIYWFISLTVWTSQKFLFLWKMAYIWEVFVLYRFRDIDPSHDLWSCPNLLSSHIWDSRNDLFLYAERYHNVL